MNIDEIIKESKRIEEDAKHSSKGHFNAAKRWNYYHYSMGIAATIFAAIAGASALSDFDNGIIIAGVSSIIATILSALATFVNPNEKSDLHHKAGTDFSALKNAARIFYNIEVSDLNNEQAFKSIKSLANRRDELNRKSPQIPPHAFKSAKSGIDRGETNYSVDK